MPHNAYPVAPAAPSLDEREAGSSAPVVLRVVQALGIAALVVASLCVIVSFLLMPVAPV